VIPLRVGLISYADYLDSLNRRLREYQLSPLRRISNAEWQQLSHSSGLGYELSYARGAAVALWADSAIRERSACRQSPDNVRQSLDNVMFDLVSEAQGAAPPELTPERVMDAFARYLGPDQVAQLRCGVPLKGQQGVVAVHAVPVVRDANQPPPARLDFDPDPHCAGVQSILQQLFHHRRRPIHNLAGGDLVGNLIGKNTNPAHKALG